MLTIYKNTPENAEKIGWARLPEHCIGDRTASNVVHDNKAGTFAFFTPPNVCKGLTFIPVPDFDQARLAFGADLPCYFQRNDLPEVPRCYEDLVQSLFFNGGSWPKMGSDVDQTKAKRAIHAWLASYAPAHEAKVATVAYALWVWSEEAAQARADTNKGG